MEKYSIEDFVIHISRQVDDVYEEKWTQAEITQIIARAMVNFFPDTKTPY